MFQKYAAAAGFALVLAAGPFAATAQTPAPMAPAGGMMVMDCSTAKAHMSAMMTPTSDAMASVNIADDVDKAYAAAMKAMVAQAQMMSKIEMKCGHNSKAMAVAKKMDDQLDSDALVVHALQTGF
jgi:DNA-binding phage protein